MGNVCGCAGSARLQDRGVVSPRRSCSCKAVAPEYHDEVEKALAEARQELDAARQRVFEDTYQIGRIIGHGAFAKVQACTHIKSGQEFAVKTVQKSPEDLKQREGIIKEVAIMRMLHGHPHVVGLQDVFEDDAHYHLVMELCSGGELFDRIISRGYFSERDAAVIMRALLDFISFAHSKHIVHRDLKPENILLTSKGPDAVLKVIDFGTSEFCKPGQRLSQKFGTPYYVAPEVLRRDYNNAADVWSSGVIMYILLCGYPPFGGKSDSRILQKVQQGSYSFVNREWNNVTEAAKAMIGDMLVMDPQQRSPAAALLQHRWFLSDGPAAAPAAALGAHMVRRLRAFANMNHMKRLALVVLARTLTDKDVNRLRELFMAMDKDDDGRIDAHDLHQALAQVGAAIDEDEMAELFQVSDMSGQGVIDYEEFIAAMLDSARVAKRRDAVRRSFEQLDRDGDGYISVEDLAQVLQDERPTMKGPAGRKMSLDMASAMVKEVDADCDGTVGFEDFRKMWGMPAIPASTAPLVA